MAAPSQSATTSSLSRPATTVLPPTNTTPSFILGSSHKSYKHQYSNIYFIRLRLLKEVVVKNAEHRWRNLAVPRVLEVTKGKLCYIVGTVYMDMPLKPNVLEDLARDNTIPPPPPVPKFYSSDDHTMLEDESGRIRIVGERLKTTRLVTGVIIGALGMETPGGEFEVVDICSANFAPQVSVNNGMEEMSVDSSESDPWVGVLSGLEVGSEASSDARIQMLIEYLTAEGGLGEDQVPASQISRLIIAGDSLGPINIPGRGDGTPQVEDRKARRNAQDAAAFSPHPIYNLSSHLLDIGRTIPVHILPGETDPSGAILPQQPLPRAMMAPGIIDEKTLSEKESSARTLLVHSGQSLNDIFKYLPNRHNSRLAILESTLKWRHLAPTAPDTLWCHPYVAEDPFIMNNTPDIYVVGGQRRFGTKLVEGEDEMQRKIRCRIVMVPNFARTGVLALINLRSLEVKCVNFGVDGMTGGGGVFEDAKVKAPAPTQIVMESLSSEQQMGGSPGPM
ncbi:hypothetical protein EST38_g1656 [Candolleomyces aberdarensis]|uniref:DNA-directed DNA polymerase n=1 Tax=Candolleomyces aberdarensis TaxID=2316362 RepID=A0A4V1Q532_9AGAR|nr:hypothetical protein EST38_g1656 [Candolleomyces aberdarensis]